MVLGRSLNLEHSTTGMLVLKHISRTCLHDQILFTAALRNTMYVLLQQLYLTTNFV